MTHRNIGGVLDLAALTALTDRNVTLRTRRDFIVAVKRLRSDGLSESAIAYQLSLSKGLVRELTHEQLPMNVCPVAAPSEDLQSLFDVVSER